MKVLIIGAGGLGRETLNIYIDSSREKEVLGFLDENPKIQNKIINGKKVYDLSYLASFPLNDQPHLISAIGSTKREKIVKKLIGDGYKFDTVIHPSLISSKWVKIGAGTIITAGVIITSQVEIGTHCIVNLGAHIGHDVKIGDYVTISPGAEIMGEVSIGDNVYIGVNATILEGIKVGNGAIIAAGAVVTKDVPEMSLVAGVPAKVKKIYKNKEEKPW